MFAWPADAEHGPLVILLRIEARDLLLETLLTHDFLGHITDFANQRRRARQRFNGAKDNDGRLCEATTVKPCVRCIGGLCCPLRAV